MVVSLIASVFKIVIEGVSVSIVDAEANPLLLDLCSEYEPCVGISSCDLELVASDTGLRLLWNVGEGKPLNYFIDVEKSLRQLRSYPAPKQGAFNQALGKKSRAVIDATGGWGGDALLMCTQGYEVTILECNPIMALMLKDAMRRLSGTAWAQDNNVVSPKVLHCDAVDYLSGSEPLLNTPRLPDQIDCVYLDPMFPEKKKKSAAVNKQMQLLQWLVGPDLDSVRLLSSAIKSGYKRIAVKRPDHADPLLRKPDTQFSSKLVHYDVYLNA